MDHNAPGEAGYIRVRIYYPAGEGLFPCLIYFHGGGWVTMTVAACDPAIRSLVNVTKCAVAAVEYRRSPEHQFPAAVNDAWVATEWIRRNAARLRLDPQRLGLIGDSAGGNLAAVTAMLARDVPGPPLRCQILLYPVTDTRTDTPSYRDRAEGYLMQRESMRWFFGHYLRNSSDADDHRVSPLRAENLTGLAPAFVVTAEYDPLRDDGWRYADRMSAAGVPVMYREYPGVIHGFALMRGVLDASRKLYQEIACVVSDRMT